MSAKGHFANERAYTKKGRHQMESERQVCVSSQFGARYVHFRKKLPPEITSIILLDISTPGDFLIPPVTVTFTMHGTLSFIGR